MKFLEKLTLAVLKIIGYGITAILPFKMILDSLFIGQETKAIISFSVAFFALIVFFIWTLWLRKIYYRKLDAIATVEEMGQNTQTGFVMSRVLKTLEYTLPFVFLTMFMKGLTYIDIPPQAVFSNILWLFLGGFLVLVLHDAVKSHFVNEMIIRDAVRLDDNKKAFRKKQEITMKRK